MQPADLLSRIVCGTDGTPAAEAALQQVLRLAPEDARIAVVSVDAITAATHPEVMGALSDRAQRALARARTMARPRVIETMELQGDPAHALLEVASENATLLAVGAHAGGRIGGALIGSVATALIHRGRCSVLVARPAPAPGIWPQRVIAGTDGSAHACWAVRAATQIATRLSRPLSVVAAGTRDPSSSSEPVQRDLREPVAALSRRASADDLLVVGSRGLHGIRALGSVSEQLAHRAPSSVLIVRGP
jgi:nucleotide-binding universal stress UspA family protein